MFISTSSMTSSTWGWTNKLLGTTSVSPTTQQGEFTGLTVANDGYAYAVPLNTPGTGQALVNSVMVLAPGDANGRYTNYSSPAGSLIAADGSGTKPNFTAGMNFMVSKGILSPTGQIWFLYSTSSDNNGFCILTPSSGTCSWQFYTITTTGLGTLSGCILGKDGYIYLIPNNLTTKLVRINSSGTIVEQVSGWYNGTSPAFGTIISKTNVTSLGTIIQLAVGDTTTNILPGYQVLLNATALDTQGVLNFNADTEVVAVNALLRQITINVAPEVPLNGANVIFRPFSKHVTGTPTNRSAISSLFPKTGGYFEKALAISDYTNTLATYNTRRNPQSNVTGNANWSGQNVTTTAFLDRYSNKIYILPKAGTQIFWIDPDNWNNRFAFHTAPGLSLTNVNIGNPSAALLYGRSSIYVGNAYKKYSAPIFTKDGNVLLPISYYNTATTNYLPASVQKILQINTLNNTISVVSDTIGAASAPNLLPNGQIFMYSITTLGSTAISYNTYQDIDSTNTNSFSAIYGKGYFYKRGNYPDYISGRGDTTGDCFSQFGAITFGTADSKNGKVIMPGNRLNYGIEYLSVKGFYTGVTKFDLLDTTIQDIPTLASLPTSLYNVYRNTQF